MSLLTYINKHTHHIHTHVCVPPPWLRADPEQGGSRGWRPRQSQHPRPRVAGVDPSASPNKQGRTIRQVLSSSQAQKLKRGPMESSLNV